MTTSSFMMSTLTASAFVVGSLLRIALKVAILSSLCTHINRKWAAHRLSPRHPPNWPGWNGHGSSDENAAIRPKTFSVQRASVFRKTNSPSLHWSIEQRLDVLGRES